MVRGAAPAFALVVGACDGSPPVGIGPDAGDDGANACAPCLTPLDNGCAEAGSCVPNLGTPAFEAWLASQTTNGMTPLCIEVQGCPELVFFVVPDGVDTQTAYGFDPTTKKLHAVVYMVNANGRTTCGAADICVPSRCMPTSDAPLMVPLYCPPIPDAGTVVDAGDASATD